MKLFGRELNEDITVSRARILALGTVAFPFIGILLTTLADENWLRISGLALAAIGLFFQGIAFFSMSQSGGEMKSDKAQTPMGTKS